MTNELQKAFEAASRLSEKDQDELAAAILDELAAEERWGESLAKSPGILESLADEALTEHRLGQTKPLDSDAG